MELVFSKMKKDWNTWTTGEEIKILRDYAERGKSLSIAFASE